MRGLGAAATLLGMLAVLTACSGSGGDTGSAGGWRVTGERIASADTSHNCPTPAPVVDTFSATPTPNPNCSPKPALGDATPTPSSSPSSQGWNTVHVLHAGDNADQSGAATQWKPVYTTYTSPPGSGVYAPMVQATTQTMPTPFDSPTPTPANTPTPLPTPAPVQTTPPQLAMPSATP